MKIELDNGCTDPRTLEVYNDFCVNHHVNALVMFYDDESNSEFVDVVFSHYTEQFQVSFDTKTEVGELYVLPPEGLTIDDVDFEEELEPIYIGIITTEKLLTFLNKMPHILSYIEPDTPNLLH
jgi:hypothetical protein